MTQIHDNKLHKKAIENHPWKNKPEKTLEEVSAKELFLLYSLLMATKNAQGYSINATNGNQQQYFSPELSTTLETYVDLLKLGVIKISAQYWPNLLTDKEESSLGSEVLINAIFELNIKPRQSHSRACKDVKREICARILAGDDIAMEAMPCWLLLNQAYCFNTIAYRIQTFDLNVESLELTTSEYLDLKELSSQLSIGWIHTLCHRAFTWTAGKQKETGMSDAKAAKLAIGSVIRQFSWALERPPLGDMYSRPKALVVFGLERLFNDIFGISPNELFQLTPNIDYLEQSLVEQYNLLQPCSTQ